MQEKKIFKQNFDMEVCYQIYKIAIKYSKKKINVILFS